MRVSQRLSSALRIDFYDHYVTIGRSPRQSRQLEKRKPAYKKLLQGEAGERSEIDEGQEKTLIRHEESIIRSI